MTTFKIFAAIVIAALTITITSATADDKKGCCANKSASKTECTTKSADKASNEKAKECCKSADKASNEKAKECCKSSEKAEAKPSTEKKTTSTNESKK